MGKNRNPLRARIRSQNIPRDTIRYKKDHGKGKTRKSSACTSHNNKETVKVGDCNLRILNEIQTNRVGGSRNLICSKPKGGPDKEGKEMPRKRCKRKV